MLQGSTGTGKVEAASAVATPLGVVSMQEESIGDTDRWIDRQIMNIVSSLVLFGETMTNCPHEYFR